MALQPGTQMMTQLEKHKREGVERRYEKKKRKKEWRQACINISQGVGSVLTHTP